MRRSCSLRIVIVVSFGGVLHSARAGEPPCPTQSGQPGPLAEAKTAAAAAGPHVPAGSEAGNVELSSDRASFGVDGRATLEGNVLVRQGGREIRADQVQYDSRDTSLSTSGHIEYRDPVVHVRGAGGSYSTSAGAEFKSAEFDLIQRAARGSASDMRLTPQGKIQLRKVTFTTCPARDDSWQLKAADITLNTRDRVGVGRGTQVDFKGVPLVYLPWVSFPLGPERKSGFLFPSLGNTSYGGIALSVPYYWNIAPQADFTFQPIEYSRAGVDLGGDLRFLTHRQKGELDWNYLPSDRSFHGSRSRVRLLDVAELADNLRLSASAENVSDPFYFENFSLGPEGTSTAFVERRATLAYRGEHWTVDGEAQQFQTIDYTLCTTSTPGCPVDLRPYARVPRIAAIADYSLGASGLVHYGLESEIVDFQRPAGAATLVTGWRADARPTLSLDLTGPGYFVRPAFAWRATGYQLEHTPIGQPRSPSRSLPVASLDSGLMFERDSGSHAERRLTLEPRVLYVDIPYRNQAALPVFDTALPDLSPVELFRANRYVGADRVSDANQASVGLTSRLLDAHDGRQFLAATLGQTYYFVTPRVTLPGETPVAGKRSDFVAQLALTAFQHWSADAAVQWDPQTRRSERSQVNLQYKHSDNAVINLAYRYERSIPLLGIPLAGTVASGFEQVETSGAWPIRHSWNLFAREVFSVRDHEPLERFAGFEYRACCWRLRLGARRYLSSHVAGAGQDTGVWLQLELAGLASVGSASDASLTEVIRGYTPAEATGAKNPGGLKGVW